MHGPSDRPMRALRRMPMFPLGSPLLPGETLPLQVFEPRYLAMMDDIGAANGEFGVVLISRGWEVGGGDQRHSVGTVASILHRSEPTEGQVTVTALGSHRLRVENWLPEDPYPLAEVEELDGAAEDAAAPAEVTDLLAGMEVGMRRVYALASELGADTGSVDLELPDAPGAAAWRIGSLLPLGAHDRQRLLDADGAGERLELAGRLIDEMVEELTMRLGAGS